MNWLDCKTPKFWVSLMEIVGPKKKTLSLQIGLSVVKVNHAVKLGARARVFKLSFQGPQSKGSGNFCESSFTLQTVPQSWYGWLSSRSRANRRPLLVSPFRDRRSSCACSRVLLANGTWLSHAPRVLWQSWTNLDLPQAAKPEWRSGKTRATNSPKNGLRET